MWPSALKGTVTKMTDKDRETQEGEEKAAAIVQIFKENAAAPERPIEEVPSRARFGVLIRRARNKAKRSLRDVANSVFETPPDGQADRRHVWLGELERGKRPPNEALVDAISENLEIDRELLMSAAQEWHKAIHSEGSFVLGDMTVKVTSLAPTAAQANELRMEVDRVITDLESIRDDVEEFADQIRVTVDLAIARSRATVDDFVTPFTLDGGAMPEITLGSGWNPNPCPRCHGSGEDPDVERIDGISDWELRCEKCNGTGQHIERFKVGRCYANSNGEFLRVMDVLDTTGHGMVLIAESSRRTDFVALGRHEGSTLNYREVPLSEWFKHWARSNPHDEELFRSAMTAMEREKTYPARGQRVMDMETGKNGVITLIMTDPFPVQDPPDRAINVTFDDGRSVNGLTCRFKLIEDDGA